MCTPSILEKMHFWNIKKPQSTRDIKNMLKLPEKLTPFDTFLPSTPSYGSKRSLLQIKSASDNLVKIGCGEVSKPSCLPFGRKPAFV